MKNVHILGMLILYLSIYSSLQEVLSEPAIFIGPEDLRYPKPQSQRNAPNRRPEIKPTYGKKSAASDRNACMKNIPNLSATNQIFSIQHLVPSQEGHDFGGLISETTKTLWFYSPYQLNSISPIEFSVVPSDGGDFVNIILLPEHQIEPGIIGISLDDLNIKIDEYKSYYWHATVYCDDPSRNNMPDHFGYAWISQTDQADWPDTLFWYDELDEQLSREPTQLISFAKDGNYVDASHVDIERLSISNPQICELLRGNFDINCD